MRGVAFGDILFASSGKKYVKNAAKTKVLEITEAPPAADEARRFRGSVPIGGHVVAANRDTTVFREDDTIFRHRPTETPLVDGKPRPGGNPAGARCVLFR